MTYYIVLLCNWPERTNAIVRGVELTTTIPTSYVTETNDYVYIMVPESKNAEIDTIMGRLVQGIGKVAMTQTPSGTGELSWAKLSTWMDTAGLSTSRKLEEWNDVVKVAWQRIGHTSIFGTL